MYYDHGCKKFLPLLTPEENKRFNLQFREIMRKNV